MESGEASRPCSMCTTLHQPCRQGCTFVPLFPASPLEDFQHVERVYGVRNIVKLLRIVRSEQNRDTAQSLLLEGYLRRNDPVLASLATVQKLKAQIEYYQNQLNIANNYLRFFQDQHRQIGTLATALGETSASAAQANPGVQPPPYQVDALYGVPAAEPLPVAMDSVDPNLLFESLSNQEGDDS